MRYELTVSVLFVHFFWGIPNSRQERCTLESQPALALEERIIGELSHIANDPGLFSRVLEKSQATKATDSEYYETLLSSKEQELHLLSKRMDGLTIAIADAPKGSGAGALLKKLDELGEQKGVLESELSELREEAESRKNKVVRMSNALILLKRFIKAFPKASPREQHEILKDLIYRITVHTDRVDMECFGEEHSLNLFDSDGVISGASSGTEGKKNAVATVGQRCAQHSNWWM